MHKIMRTIDLFTRMISLYTSTDHDILQSVSASYRNKDMDYAFSRTGPMNIGRDINDLPTELLCC